jgi:hypothetical protein
MFIQKMNNIADMDLTNFLKKIDKYSENVMKNTNEMKKTSADIRDIADVIKTYTKKLNDYIDREGEILEEVTNGYVIKYFKHCPLFSDLYIYKDEEWKYLYLPTIKEKVYKNRKQITEFDGLYIFSKTNLMNVIKTDLEEIKTPKQRNNNTNNSKQSKPWFVILEAKHSLSKTEVQHKIKKYIDFQNYIQNGSNTEFVKNSTDEYKNKVSNYKFDERFFDTKLYIYFAGEYVTDSLITYIRDNSEEWKQNNIFVSAIQKNNDDYKMFDIFSNYEANNTKYGRLHGNSMRTTRINIAS